MSTHAKSSARQRNLKPTRAMLRRKLDTLQSSVAQSPRSALTLARDIVKMAQANRYKAEEARAHELSGLCYEKLGRYESALLELEEAICYFRRRGRQGDEWQCRLVQADVWYKQGRLAQARAALDEVIAYFRAERVSADLARALSTQGRVVLAMGDAESAEHYYVEALQLAGVSGEPELISVVLADSGYFYLHVSRLPEAMERFQESIGRAEEHSIVWARATMGLAAVYRKCGEYALAFLNFGKAQNVFDAEGDSFGMLQVLHHIAATQEHLGQVEKALDTCHEALELARLYGARGLEAQSLERIGKLKIRTRDWEGATRVFEEAATMYKDVGDCCGGCSMLFSSALAYYGKGALESARHDFSLALERSAALCAREIQVESQIYLGEIALQEGECERARDYLNSALELARKCNLRPLECECHRKMADLFDQCEELQNKEASLFHYKRFLDIHMSILNVENQRSLLELQARSELKALACINERLRLKAHKLEKDLDATHRLMAENHTTLERVLRDVELISSQDKRVMKTVEALLCQLRKQGDKEKRLRELEEHINTQHADFKQLLIAHCSGLTKTELNVCALMREQLATKKIAGLMAISERTVEKHRANIRKKLHLPQRMSFPAYFASL